MGRNRQASEPKARVAVRKIAGWGDLNVALNGLVRDGVFAAYQTGVDKDGSRVSIELEIAAGADQAAIVRQTREALPDGFTDAQIRTRAS